MNDKKDTVKWGQLTIVITVLIVVFGAVWTAINSLQKDLTQVKVDVATTKNDVGWLRGEWEKLTGKGEVSLKGSLLDKMYSHE